MSEHDRSPIEQSNDSLRQPGNSSGNDNLDSSILGMMKSRVSSIIPNSLSRWFSPTAKNNDTVNGGISTARRRRRLEVDNEEEDDENYDEEVADEEEQEHYEQRQQQPLRDDYIHPPRDADSDEESNNSNSETHNVIVPKKITRADLNMPIGIHKQPLSKRTRFDVDLSFKAKNARDSPMLQHQPLVASTPASNLRISMPPSVLVGRAPVNRYKHLNLYGCKKEPAYNFLDATDASEAPQTSGWNESKLSSHRSLNIPSSANQPMERNISFTDYKRQTLASVNNEDNPSTSIGSIKSYQHAPTRTSTTIFENVTEETEEEGNINAIEAANASTLTTYNGRKTNKKQKLINGTASIDGLRDSVSESSDGAAEDSLHIHSSKAADAAVQRKTGLFNMSSGVNSRIGSRTSSFSNGLNFQAHLEGRKSLFGSAQDTQRNNSSNNLNSSTMSLTSLNRRQFNASLYGSTSALSDSRLLNTFSPFYQGRTTYGGASAYNKYEIGKSSGTASSVRIAPTIIRPTSSLSTLSSSSNSLAGEISTGAISTTATRILNLLNDFSTPLSEAKKMANHIRKRQQQTKQNDTDQQSSQSRPMCLSHLRTPYGRSYTNGKVALNSILPPVRELQVPSMSQIVQMKKCSAMQQLQTATERSRQVAAKVKHHQDNHSPTLTTEYTLPPIANQFTESEGDGIRETRQKHKITKYKIRNKVTRSVRTTGTKEVSEEPPPPLNLPNIAFPVMQSVPKIDISLPKPTIQNSVATTSASSVRNTFSGVSSANESILPISNTLTDNLSPKCATDFINFKFSNPLDLESVSPQSLHTISSEGNYKLSPPILFNITTITDFLLRPTPILDAKQVPILDTGSVFDESAKAETSESGVKAVSTSTTTTNLFGIQFKKSINNWECGTCLVSNNQEASKCIACEMPRPTSAVTDKNTTLTTSTTTLPTVTSTFGNKFRKTSNEWECSLCMVRNNATASKCVACEEPKKDVKLTAANATNKSFGNAFKPKADTWECGTCCIRNTNETAICKACETKRLETNKNTLPTSNFGAADKEFKKIVDQQKAAKWECEACMTQNEILHQKCVCCEQLKPGTQITNDDVSKHMFGTTAAAKFSFGFGTAANEDELRKANNATTKNTTPTTTANVGILSTDSTTTSFKFGTVSDKSVKPAASIQSNFTFGIKPATTNANIIDLTDGKMTASVPTAVTTALTGFQFGVNTTKTTEPISTVCTVVASNSATVTTTTTATVAPTTTTTTSPFNLTNTRRIVAATFNIGDAAQKNSVSSFGIDSNNASKITASPKMVTEFNFGTTTQQLKKPQEEAIANKTGGNFVFTSSSKSEAAITTTAAPSSINTFSFTAAAASAPKNVNIAAVKPIFGGTNTTSSLNVTTTTNSASGFSFVAAAAAPTTAKTSAFGLTQSTTAPTTTNIFGVTTTTTSTSSKPATFGSSNIFGGTFANPNISKNPINTATPQFGSTTSSAAAPLTTPSFVFGSSMPNVSNASTPVAGTVVSSTSSAGTWPKHNFVFGSSSGNTNDGNNTTFGFSNTDTSAAVSSNNTTVTSSIFGNTTVPKLTPTTNFGTGAVSTIATTFDANTGGTGLQGGNNNISASNLFSAASSGNAATPASAFRSSPFGGAGGSFNTNATPTFGSTAVAASTTTTFGSFGGATNNVTSDGASAAKKYEPAFNFGSNVAASSSSGASFNFGTTPAPVQPAFNFTPTNQPAFNFTGTTTGATSNTPFQFNAGGMPASNNIFAPTPSSSGQQSAQQARRKLRGTTSRRLPPR